MPVKLLDAVTAAGASSTWNLVHGCSQHTVAAVFTGTVTALVVDLEGSIDGTSWFQIATHTFTAGEITAKQAMFHLVNAPVPKVRVNITTYTGTGPVTVKYFGYEDSSRS